MILSRNYSTRHRYRLTTFTTNAFRSTNQRKLSEFRHSLSGKRRHKQCSQLASSDIEWFFVCIEHYPSHWAIFLDFIHACIPKTILINAISLFLRIEHCVLVCVMNSRRMFMYMCSVRLFSLFFVIQQNRVRRSFFICWIVVVYNTIFCVFMRSTSFVALRCIVCHCCWYRRCLICLFFLSGFSSFTTSSDMLLLLLLRYLLCFIFFRSLYSSSLTTSFSDCFECARECQSFFLCGVLVCRTPIFMYKNWFSINSLCCLQYLLIFVMLCC